jgi:hypothetical protein
MFDMDVTHYLIILIINGRRGFTLIISQLLMRLFYGNGATTVSASADNTKALSDGATGASYDGTQLRKYRALGLESRYRGHKEFRKLEDSRGGHLIWFVSLRCHVRVTESGYSMGPQ